MSKDEAELNESLRIVLGACNTKLQKCQSKWDIYYLSHKIIPTILKLMSGELKIVKANPDNTGI